MSNQELAVAFHVTQDELFALQNDIKKWKDGNRRIDFRPPSIDGMQVDALINPQITTNTSSPHWYLYLVNDSFFSMFPQWETFNLPILGAKARKI